MVQEYIHIRGARENNLKNVSLALPKRKITVFTGVSGSGKSSLVFDTMAAEANRLLNENFSLFARTLLPKCCHGGAHGLQQLSVMRILNASGDLTCLIGSTIAPPEKRS